MLLAERGAAISDQLARRVIALRWYLLVVEFRVKVKLRVVFSSWVKIKEALLASHDPDDLVSLGFRFTNSWIVLF